MNELKACIVPGCSKPRKNSKYCSMHSARLYRTGSLDKKTPYQRLLERISVDDGGCWNYTKYINESGYGRLRASGKKVIASRLSFESVKGKIPMGMFVLHTCDNPACVNPDHLYLGNAKDNAKDMVNRKRQWLQRAKEQGLKFDIFNGVQPNEYRKI